VRNALCRDRLGDSALIVDETGSVVAPEIRMRWPKHGGSFIEAGPGVRRSLGMAARRRVQQHFALPAIVERYRQSTRSWPAEHYEVCLLRASRKCAR